MPGKIASAPAAAEVGEGEYDFGEEQVVVKFQLLKGGKEEECRCPQGMRRDLSWRKGWTMTMSDHHDMQFMSVP